MATPKSWYIGFVVGFALVAPTTFAGEAPPPDARNVVADQLSAFERDDASTVWKLTAPEMREKFGSAANFIGIVRSKYGPISTHRSVDFGPSMRKGDQVGMVVTIVDNDNDVWSALFLLSKQSDGAWRTSDCLLTKAPQTSV
jgi:Domain of unknown function (DUF4864)